MMSALAFFSTLASSAFLILLTEFGDKTFFVAAILAIKYKDEYLLIYLACWLALAAMTVLSGLIGVLVPSLLGRLQLLPRPFVAMVSSAMLIAFGLQLLYEGLTPLLVSEETNPKEHRSARSENSEKQEAEKEIEEARFFADAKAKGSEAEIAQWKYILATSFSSTLERIADWFEKHDIRMPLPNHTPLDANSLRRAASQNVDSMILFMEIFVMNFLAEWGDKSQFATVALSSATPSASSTMGVLLGGVLGHAVCTGIAVTFGHAVSEQVDASYLNIAGGSLFLVFGAQILIHA